MSAHVPTSAVLQRLRSEAPPDHVSVGWIMEQLEERSFGLLMFLLAVIALVPGLSTFIGVLFAVPAYQMIVARRSPALPRVATARRLPTRRFAQVVDRIAPVLRRAETLVRPRWPRPFRTTKRMVGITILLLGLTLALPVPFGHILPAFVIMIVALAYLEEDGVVLCLGLALALVSFSITAAAGWGAVAGIEWLDRL
ncbi:exopolysaccharide biosynthesis protein [Hypericibacter sp.]|uniref:exopolysaccharide biosynthesis protein n=1 Tax=Hypericibacter sp. TaxID=2705401 RepID=UPI003D6CFB02